MAIGTITRGGSPHDYTVSNKQYRIRDVQLTSGANYVQGGTSITAAQLGMKVINAVHTSGPAMSTDGSTARSVGFKIATGGQSVSFFVYTTASAEAATNSNQSDYSIRVTFVGRR